jgi:hypothetical protein
MNDTKGRIEYECDRCHNFQHIGHPMYRYQSSPNTFSTATWACQSLGCRGYTHWKIRENHIQYIPQKDIPKSWKSTATDADTLKKAILHTPKNAARIEYECDRCHRFQSIRHPMYQYQASPDAFSDATWACHVGCRDYTHWRIHQDQISHIPPDKIPESWNTNKNSSNNNNNNNNNGSSSSSN